MSVVVILAALAVASSVPLLVFSAVAGRAASSRVSRNLAAGLAVPTDVRALVLSRPARERALNPIMQALARQGHRLTPGGVVAALERRLHLAGDPWPIERVMVAKVALVAVAAGAGVLRVIVAPSPAAILLVPAAIVAAVCVPEAVVARRARERQGHILVALPDTLDQLTICVEAGLGFDAALTKIAATSSGPLGEEIHRVLQDIQIGIPRTEALSRMLERTDVAELRQFVHAIAQAESYGVPIASVLRVQASELRQKRASRAEERAQKMPVKLVFPLVFCILPSLFVVVIGPAALRVAENILK